MKNKKAEIGTVVMMALLVIVSLISFGSSKFLSSKKTSSTQATGGVVRYGSANCTCSQICGISSNYVPSSQQITSSGARQCTCKQDTPASTCSINYNDNDLSAVPTINENPGKCSSGSYMALVDCVNACGVGNCQSCMLGSTIKYECNVSSDLDLCKKPRTYASLSNCQGECSNDCTQCKVEDMVRYECGGVGPTMAPYATPTSPPENKEDICKKSGGYCAPNVGDCEGRGTIAGEAKKYCESIGKKICCKKTISSPPDSNRGVEVDCQEITCPEGTEGGPYYTTKIEISGTDYDWYYVNKATCENKITNCDLDCGVGPIGKSFIENKVCMNSGANASDGENEINVSTTSTPEPTPTVAADLSICQTNIPCGNNPNITYSVKCTSIGSNNECVSPLYFENPNSCTGTSFIDVASWCVTKTTQVNINYTINATGNIDLAQNNTCYLTSDYGTDKVDASGHYIIISVLKDNILLSSKRIDNRPTQFPLTGSFSVTTTTGGSFQINVSYLTGISDDGYCIATYRSVTSGSVEQAAGNVPDLSVDLVNAK